MHIRDHARAQGWFRKHAAAPSSVGSWKAFVARNNRSQEPRNMAEGGLMEEYYGKDKLDWMKNHKDQMSFEEYLRWKRSGSFAHGGSAGQLVAPSVDGSRPGYKGARGGNRELFDQLVEEANKGFKLVKRKDLQVKAGYNISTNLMSNLDTLEIKLKKAFEHVMGDPNKLVSEMFDPMTQVKKLVGTNDAPGRYLKGWAPYEESRRLIKNLAVPLSKQRLSKLDDLTLGELDFRISNNVKEELLYSSPRKVTNETKIFDIVKRHVDQGGKELEWITKPGKTELGYPSYSEAKFKYKGKTYDMAELINNAETDPNFKEFFQAQKDYKKINGEIVKHPKTGKNIKFGDLMQEVYGYKRPYAVDHAGSILKEPFSNLRVLPNRINAAAGTISQYTDKFIVDPAKKGKYTEVGKASQLEKIGYNFNQSIDDLIKAEMNLANDVLVKERVLRTPNQIVDSLRQGENYVPDFYTKDAKPGSGFAKQLEIGKELNIKGLFNTYQNAGIGKSCGFGKAQGGRIGFAAGGGYDDCMKNAIQEHNKKLQSKDISVKNAARAKQFGILKNANKLKGVKNLLQMGRKGFQAITGTVGTAVGGWGGAAIEAAIEGLFYEHYRRAGYNDKQAQAETFFYKMDQGDETGVWEGAEDLLKDELVGKRDKEGYLKSAQPHGESWFDVGADKYQTQKDALDAEIATNSKLDFELGILKNQRRPGTEEQIAAKEQELNDSYDRIDELQITLKQGTPEQEAYARAEEKQKALQDERAQKHWGDTPAYKAGKRKQWKDEFLEYKQAKPRYRKDKPYAFRESEIEANIGPEKGMIIPWEEAFPRSVDDPRTTEQQKWDYIYNQGGFDLTDKIGIAGGVSKMATGGIISLKKK